MPKLSSNYYRKSFGLKEEVQPELQRQYDSDLITQMRQNGYLLSKNGVTIKLAEAFGFCWGVDRAVSMAYEARRHFPNQRIWITNEIIHNPLVNDRLRQMRIDFVPVGADLSKDFSQVAPGDVVILPAFGASGQEMQLLESKGCQIVDTTCPWVSRVWNRINKYKQADFTALIHGKYNHEETIATASRADKYLIVQNLAEAQWVCDYILGLHIRSDFLSRFDKKCSPGFDPAQDLVRLGVANQTTMLKGETEQIGKLFEKTMLEKYGPLAINEHFLSSGDTICDATQERQDAMFHLVAQSLDLILVIGGYNSSNTGHLYEIALEKGLPAYHIDGSWCIGPGNKISHKLNPRSECVVTKDWLPSGDVTIGITAGASTPDQVVAGVIENIFLLKSNPTS